MENPFQLNPLLLFLHNLLSQLLCNGLEEDELLGLQLKFLARLVGLPLGNVMELKSLDGGFGHYLLPQLYDSV